MTNDPVRTCGAKTTSPPFLVCDREKGHAGSHSRYWEQIDEIMFWPNRTEPREDATDSTPLGNLTVRCRKGHEHMSIMAAAACDRN